jgi:hypothetical protein
MAKHTMTPEDITEAFRRIAAEPDPVKWLAMECTLYQRALIAIACGDASPDPVTLARAVMHESAHRDMPEGGG